MRDETDEFRVPQSTFRAYLELLRIPNVFTAVADVMMGYLVVNRSYDPWAPLLMLVGTSACLYLAGMVLNDVFDRDIDAIERPERPIPSGRVTVGAAKTLAIVLLVGAGALAAAASWKLAMIRPLVIACVLALLVIAYDKWLKHTVAGPAAMGCCRTLNVLLGMSGAAAVLREMDWTIAAGVGVYVAGVTIFARQEADISSRRRLAAGLAVMLLGMLMIAAVPWLFEDWRLFGLDQRWLLFWSLLAAHLVWRCGQAVVHPDPLRVRRAVTNAIMSIIVIDAAASLVGSGVAIFSFLILVLIVPATFLGRWIYST